MENYFVTTTQGQSNNKDLVIGKQLLIVLWILYEDNLTEDFSTKLIATKSKAAYKQLIAISQKEILRISCLMSFLQPYKKKSQCCLEKAILHQTSIERVNLFLT